MVSRSAQASYDAPAIVIGLDSLTGLQTARVLAASGVPVFALAKDPSHYCCWTRACKSPVAVDTESIDLISYLEETGPQRSEKPVLFPCTDLSVLQISEHRDRLAPWYHIALADHAIVRQLLDKARFVEFAEEHDIPVPRSFILRDSADAVLASKELVFPCVIKPAVKSPSWQKQIAKKAVIAHDAEQLQLLYEQLSPWAEELVVQQWIDGPLTNQLTCNAYFDAASQPLVTFVTRKLRQWPMEAGIACFSEECCDSEVQDTTVRLFQRAGYRGLGYLEMKRDHRDGRCYVIEPNIGRPTGRATAAEAGGVELLMTAYCDALGLPLPEARTQQFTRVKWIYRRRDLQASWNLWRQGRLSISQWRRSLRGPKVDAVFQWRDWWPFVGDIVRSFRKGCANTVSPSKDVHQKATSKSVKPAARVA